MNIRADVQQTYRCSLEASGDRTRAYLEAAARFGDVAGYSPDKPLLDRLLHGALLGVDHPLMKLLTTSAVIPTLHNPAAPEIRTPGEWHSLG